MTVSIQEALQKENSDLYRRIEQHRVIERTQETLQKENSSLYRRIEQHKVIERMQKSIIDAGGRFFSTDELTNMTIADFVNQFGPNGVTLTTIVERKK